MQFWPSSTAAFSIPVINMCINVVSWAVGSCTSSHAFKSSPYAKSSQVKHLVQHVRSHQSRIHKQNDWHSRYWTVGLSGISVSGTKVGVAVTEVVIDSGTSAILMGAADCAAIHQVSSLPDHLTVPVSLNRQMGDAHRYSWQRTGANKGAQPCMKHPTSGLKGAHLCPQGFQQPWNALVFICCLSQRLLVSTKVRLLDDGSMSLFERRPSRACTTTPTAATG
jgi:hypothetical protein